MREIDQYLQTLAQLFMTGEQIDSHIHLDVTSCVVKSIYPQIASWHRSARPTRRKQQPRREEDQQAADDFDGVTPRSREVHWRQLSGFSLLDRAHRPGVLSHDVNCFRSVGLTQFVKRRRVSVTGVCDQISAKPPRVLPLGAAK